MLSGRGLINALPVLLAAMDFRFLGASMGSVAGEKITRAIEAATAEGKPVIIFSASGGARMHEGILSLMQMAKTSAALARHHDAGLAFISVLTHPTFGGVTASFATLGDLIIAEPGCMIGFAGPRVVKETTHQNLPAGFQTAEFMMEHGLVDFIVDRRQMRADSHPGPGLREPPPLRRLKPTDGVTGHGKRSALILPASMTRSATPCPKPDASPAGGGSPVWPPLSRRPPSEPPAPKTNRWRRRWTPCARGADLPALGAMAISGSKILEEAVTGLRLRTTPAAPVTRDDIFPHRIDHQIDDRRAGRAVCGKGHDCAGTAHSARCWTDCRCTAKVRPVTLWQLLRHRSGLRRDIPDGLYEELRLSDKPPLRQRRELARVMLANPPEREPESPSNTPTPATPSPA